MPDTIIDSVLTGKLDLNLLTRWLNNESIEDAPEDCLLFCCNRSDFVDYFLSYIRDQTDSILQSNSNGILLQHQNTPEKFLGRHKHRRSISDPTSQQDRSMDNLSVKQDKQKNQESPSKDKGKRSGRRVKTKLFTDDTKNVSASSDESRISVGIDRIAISTPMKNGVKLSEYPNLPSPVTPQSRSFKEHDRCDTPRLGRHSRSSDKSVSLGDFIINSSSKNSKKRRSNKNISSDNDGDVKELDISNSDMFPEIGARKASSLRTERRRIKPTNIDKTQKSASLNSFNSECFQQPSPLALEDNLAFKLQKIQPKESTNSFEAERSILKQERHKLMEKFNFLNTSSSPKPTVTPQIKIISKDCEPNMNYITADVTKMVLKEKLDILVEIYNILMQNSLILSVNTEIYYMISIILSKQCENNYLEVEKHLSENNLDYLMKSVHNCTYFAVKTLWFQRGVLEVILDKNSLKTLGENRKVRSFYGDLAKFLLNAYGLKCEAETNENQSRNSSEGNESRSNGIVRFNIETDNAENFPSVLSFQTFKKQRDMFYEILRWYQETAPTSRSSLRGRVKAAVGVAPANHAHLATLFTMHMSAECAVTSSQESKLSKLQRRLTGPAPAESHRAPRFTQKEMFYKDFVVSAENESFRTHVKDALASEVVTADATSLGGDDRGNSNPVELSQQYHRLIARVCSLAKLLGFLTSLPYSPQMIKNKPTKAARDMCQPILDLKGMLHHSSQHNRLSITIPWMVHYLSMLDPTTLRTKYYHELLKTLQEIYQTKLKTKTGNTMSNKTVIYLKATLSWLFELPQFPQNLLNEELEASVASELAVDNYDFIDEGLLFDLCPFLKDVNQLLSTCRVGQEKDIGSYRHITPVSLSLNPEERLKSKEMELQYRLEEEYLKSQPSSTRRVIELVTERVTSGCVRHVSGPARTDARDRAWRVARDKIGELACGGADQATLTKTLTAIYAEHLTIFRATSTAWANATVPTRVSASIKALLPTSGTRLASAVGKRVGRTVNKWIASYCSDISILSKDLNEDVRSLRSAVELPGPASPAAPRDVPETPSVALALIYIKEHTCLLMEYAATPPLSLSVIPTAIARRPLLQATVTLATVYVSRKPKDLDDTLLSKFHSIWNLCCPDRKRQEVQEMEPERDFSGDDRAPTPVSDEETPVNGVREVKSDLCQVKSEKSDISEKSDFNVTECGDKLLDVFERILCPRNIMLIQHSRCKPEEVWEAMATLLVFLLKHNYLNEDSLTEQCLATYRQDWPQNILEHLSTCMKLVSSRWSRGSAGKFTLFLDFLSEYCGDLEYD